MVRLGEEAGVGAEAVDEAAECIEDSGALRAEEITHHNTVF